MNRVRRSISLVGTSATRPGSTALAAGLALVALGAPIRAEPPSEPVAGLDPAATSAETTPTARDRGRTEADVVEPTAGAETTGSHAAVLLDDRFAADEGTEHEPYGAPGLGQTFFEMLLSLGVVCLLAYLLLGKLLPRLLRVPAASASGRLLSVVDRLPIDPRRSLMVVKMGEQHFLVGSSEQGLTLLARLDPSEVRDALAAATFETRPPPWAGWSSLFGSRAGGEP